MEVGRLLRYFKGTSVFIDLFLVNTFLAFHLVRGYGPDSKKPQPRRRRFKKTMFTSKDVDKMDVANNFMLLNN